MGHDSRGNIMPGLEDIEKKRKDYEKLLRVFLGDLDDLCFLPPVPSQKLLAASGLNRTVLSVLNKAVVERKAILNKSEKLVFIPLWSNDAVVGVAVARYSDKSVAENGRFMTCADVLSRLFVENVRLEKVQKIDVETGLMSESVFFEELKSIVGLHVHGESYRNQGEESAFGDAAEPFCVCLLRNLSNEFYPVNLWSNKWLEAKEFAAGIAAKLPPGVTGALLRSGEVGIIFPGNSNALRKLMSEEFSGGNEDFRGALVDFPFDPGEFGKVRDTGAPVSGETWISVIFERLRTILDTTVTNSHKRLWSWHDLTCLGTAPGSAFVFDDNFVGRTENLESFAIMAMSFKREKLEVSFYPACRKLENILNEVFRDNFFCRWLPGSILVVVLPGLHKEDAEELARHLLSDVGKAIGEALNVGISCFPFHDFSREEAIYNSLKALVHARLSNDHGFVFVDSVTFNLSGDNHFNQGRLELARKEYEKGVRVDAANTNLLNSLGVCCAELGLPDEAEKAFAKVLSMRPDDFMANFNLGCLRMRQQRLTEAEEMLIKAIETNPASAEAHFSLAKIRFEVGDYVDAIFHLEKVVAGRKSWKAARRLLAESYARAGNKKKAMDHYKHVLRLDPGDAMSLHALGRLYGEESGNLEVAISLCEKAVGFDAENVKYRLSLAKLLYRAGDFEGALNHLRAIVAGDGNNQEVEKLKEEVEESLRKTKATFNGNGTSVNPGKHDDT